jgi:hypothetical protein
MNLFDLLAQSQGGQAIDNLASQFGLDRSQTEAALRQLVPALGAGLARNTSNGKGLADLIGALTNGDHQRYAEDPTHTNDQQAVDDGNGILGHLFGSKEVSRQVADRVAAQTGIGSEIIKRMLPVIATMVMGGLAKQVAGAGAREIADSVLNKMSQRGGGLLGGLAGSAVTTGAGWLLKRVVFGSGTPQKRSIFGSLLDKDGDGSYADDLIRMAAKGLLNK